MRIVWGIVTSCILIGFVLVIRGLFGKYISKRIQYALWLLVAVKLIVFPVPWVESSLALFDANAQVSLFEGDINTVSSDNPVMNEQIHTSNNMNNFDGSFGYDLGQKEAVVSDNSVYLSQEMLQPTGAPQLSETPQNAGAPQPAKSSINWLMLLVILEAAGAIMVLGYTVYYNLKFRKYLHENRVDIDVSNITFEKGREVTIPVYSVKSIPSPCLFGNAIYVSEGLAEDKEKLRHVLAHEYSHYRHKDQLWSVVRCICLALYFWNPICIIGAYVSKQDCELACDESALLLLGESERLPYGRTLIGLIAMKPSVKDGIMIATTMSASKKSLKSRVANISKKQKNIISVCIGVAAVLSVTLIATSSVKAQDNNHLVMYAGDKTVYESYENVLAVSEQYGGFAYLNVTGCDSKVLLVAVETITTSDDTKTMGYTSSNVRVYGPCGDGVVCYGELIGNSNEYPLAVSEGYLYSVEADGVHKYAVNTEHKCLEEK